MADVQLFDLRYRAHRPDVGDREAVAGVNRKSEARAPLRGAPDLLQRRGLAAGVRIAPGVQLDRVAPEIARALDAVHRRVDEQRCADARPAQLTDGRAHARRIA